MRNKLHFVDVFTRERYAGNQLAVVEDANSLSDDEMQALAAEIGFSETTFVEGKSANKWNVRIFTPNTEIPFAGHPTIGTAYIIREHIASTAPDTVTLELGVGSIPVTVREHDGHETLWMEQQPPEFGPELSHKALADVLSLDDATIDTDLPVQVVSTGLPTIIVPLHSREALTDIEMNRGAYDAVTGDREAKSILAFCQQPRHGENDVAVRVFAPFYDVPEDPATGSSNGCLAAYLAHYEILAASEIDIRIEQGYEIDRPSLLYLQARQGEDHIHVEEGGTVVPVAHGNLACDEALSSYSVR